MWSNTPSTRVEISSKQTTQNEYGKVWENWRTKSVLFHVPGLFCQSNTATCISFDILIWSVDSLNWPKYFPIILSNCTILLDHKCAQNQQKVIRGCRLNINNFWCRQIAGFSWSYQRDLFIHHEDTARSRDWYRVKQMYLIAFSGIAILSKSNNCVKR